MCDFWLINLVQHMKCVHLFRWKGDKEGTLAKCSKLLKSWSDLAYSQYFRWVSSLRVVKDVNSGEGSGALCNLSVWEPRFCGLTWDWEVAVASAINQYHWQDPSLSTESSRCEKPSACFSVPGVAGLSPGRTSYPNLAYSPLQFLPCNGAASE